MLDQPPVRLCCFQRHDGVVCPDGRVMCCLCFEKVDQDELVVEEDGTKVDVCQRCKAAEDELVRIVDENKRKKLIEISYEIGACGICLSGNFVDGQDFGTCGSHQYRHLKHAVSERDLSINRYGRCPYLFPDAEKVAKLGLFEEFVFPPVTDA